ncbi:TLD-domain-containing protein [Gaertneriomyces semiglobifer]|nr:TLD-domain-containing protein [Gaertneriomyces semiglobifer]
MVLSLQSPTEDALQAVLPKLIPERLRRVVALKAAEYSSTGKSGQKRLITVNGLTRAVDSLCSLKGGAALGDVWLKIYSDDSTGVQAFLKDIADSGIATLYQIRAETPSEPCSVSESFVEFLAEEWAAGQSYQQAYDMTDFDAELSGSADASRKQSSLKLKTLPQTTHIPVLFTAAFAPLTSSVKSATLPHLPPSSLLNPESLFLIHTQLPVELQRQSWRRIYDSRSGGSWTSFREAVEDVGWEIVVIKDKDGHVFGGFTTPLNIKPTFQGDPSTFLFALHPKYGIYPTAGINSNYVYLNHGATTFPNGLAFGGQLSYFGLYVSDNFTTGHSMASPRSTTFNSPQLSGHPDFEIDTVEVYLIKEVERDDRLVDPKEARRAKGSILEQAEAMTVLEMGGRKIWTKDARGDVDGSPARNLEDENEKVS